MKNAFDLAMQLYGNPKPTMPGTGMAKMAADDMTLRPLWLKDQERMAMGEIPQIDYEAWKAMKTREMAQVQPQPRTR
jgi:hypothetical protein